MTITSREVNKMWCRQQSANHQGLLCNLHCATTVVLREQLNFKSAVIRSERSSCYNCSALIFTVLTRQLHVVVIRLSGSTQEHFLVELIFRHFGIPISAQQNSAFQR